MKAALERIAGSKMSGEDRRRMRRVGGAHYLRLARAELEKLDLGVADWQAVKACLDKMINELSGGRDADRR